MNYSAPQSPPWRKPSIRLFLDVAVASHARAIAFLSILCLLSFLPGFFHIPPIDRDEALFAQASKQMVETGEYVDIRFQQSGRYKKPVGIYWLQAAIVHTAEAAGMSGARTTIWLYRLPSLVGAIGAVLLTYWTALAFTTRRGAILAGMMMATSILLGVEARLAKTDAMLLLTIVAAMGAMARVYLGLADGRREWKTAAIFWTAMAGGVLIKGPLIFLFVGLTAGALSLYDRSWRWLFKLRPLAGVPWLILLVLPWFLAILLRTNGEFFAGSVGEDFLGKIMNGQELHGAPPGYYVILFFITFWPGAMLLGMTLPSIWRDRFEARTRFLLAWIVPAWIVFEIVVTKLPHYVLPCFPAIAILIAARLDPAHLSRTKWLERFAAGWFVLPAVACFGTIVVLIAFQGDPAVLAWPFAAGALFFGLMAWRLYRTDGAELSLMRAAVASILVVITVDAVVLPSFRNLFPAVAMADVLRKADCPSPVAASAGYGEPSVVFLVGTPTLITNGAGAADFLRGGSCRFAFVDQSQERNFAQRAEAIGLRYTSAPRVYGLDISKGRRKFMAVFRSAD